MWKHFCSLVKSISKTNQIDWTQRVLHSRSDHTTKEKMPRDGTVFQLTSNVILFLEQLLDFVETVASILQQDSSYNQVSSARVLRLHAKNLFGSSGFHFLYIFLSTWYLVRKIRFRCSTFRVTLSICATTGLIQEIKKAKFRWGSGKKMKRGRSQMTSAKF